MASLNELLIFAARAGNAALVSERIEAGADPNYRDERHGSALLEAVRGGHGALVQALLTHGADPNRAVWRGDGPLELALHYGHDDLVAVLLQAQTRLRPHSTATYRQLLAESLERGGRHDAPAT